MKLLIVAKNPAIENLLKYHLTPVGFEVVQYDNPMKAIKGFEALDPQMILFHAVDFPRHWKPLLKLLRGRRSKEESVFILLKDETFPLEEAAKATHLGVNGMINASIQPKQEIHRLAELFRRYRSIKDKRKFHRLIPDELDRMQLLFTHPYSLAIITGNLSEISIRGASFKPADPELTSGLRREQELSLCSLRIGEDIIALTCRVTRNSGGELGLQFKSFETGGHHKLFQRIQSRAERELKVVAGGKD